MKFHPLLSFCALSIAGALVFTSCGGGGNGPSRPNATATPVPGAPTPTPIPGAPTPTPAPGAPTPTPTMAPVSLRGQIGFVSTRDGNPDIFLMDAQGNNQRSFSAINSGSDDNSPTLAPDGTRIVWSSNRPNQASSANFEIYTARADGTNITAYTNDNGDFAPDDTEPVISPNGLKIAWTTTRGGNRNIATMDITGGNQVVLTLANEGEDSQPAWTSDSQTIAFYSERGTTRGIYLMDVSGTNQRALLTTEDNETVRYRRPAYAPNGQLFAVNFENRGTNTISLRKLDGTPATTNLAFVGGSIVRSNPSFSPNSNSLIYTGSNGAGSEQIYTANLDGTGERPLTSAGNNFEAKFAG